MKQHSTQASASTEARTSTTFYPPVPELANLDLVATFDEATALDLPAAAKLCRGRYQHKAPHVKCVLRWMLKGRKVGRQGLPAIVLPSVLYAGRRLTMLLWLQAWQRACARAAVTPIRPPPPPSGKRVEARRQREQERAERLLDQWGIGGRKA